MAAITAPEDVAAGLAMALVEGSNAPLLLLDGELAILGASASFCQTFDFDPHRVCDGKIFELGGGEWDRPQLRSLLKLTSRGMADVSGYEMDLVRTGRDTRRLVIHARRLAYGDDDNVRMLVTVLDVTAARITDQLKDDLLREKSVLVQEVQHRVANSLQIIASVLLQSARKVQSDETRIHLHDAHHRVMSVASVQTHLSSSGTGEVELRSYLLSLCQSLSASMIEDPGQISLVVDVDASVVSANMSVSLGLVVTELVINALKHAFPGRRQGRITVSYAATGAQWTLAVTDNGVGMRNERGGAKSGLGTSIVNALAWQLDARVEVADAYPGAKVMVVHPQSAAMEALRRVNQPV